MALKFQLIREFPTDSPPALKEALSRLERNVEAQFFSVVQAIDAPLQVAERISSSGRTALPGQATPVDTSAGSLTVLIPSPAATKRKTLVLIKTSSANTLTVQPVSGAINGAASLAITAIGARVLYSDGEGYWA